MARYPGPLPETPQTIAPPPTKAPRADARNLPDGYPVPANVIDIVYGGPSPTPEQVAAASTRAFLRANPARRSRWATLMNLEINLGDPSGRVEFIRQIGALLRPYSGEAADYLESYGEDC